MASKRGRIIFFAFCFRVRLFLRSGGTPNGVLTGPVESSVDSVPKKDSASVTFSDFSASSARAETFSCGISFLQFARLLHFRCLAVVSVLIAHHVQQRYLACVRWRLSFVLGTTSVLLIYRRVVGQMWRFLRFHGTKSFRVSVMGMTAKQVLHMGWKNCFAWKWGDLFLK